MAPRRAQLFIGGGDGIDLLLQQPLKESPNCPAVGIGLNDRQQPIVFARRSSAPPPICPLYTLTRSGGAGNRDSGPRCRGVAAEGDATSSSIGLSPLIEDPCLIPAHPTAQRFAGFHFTVFQQRRR
jgi:hypothetical protein